MLSMRSHVLRMSFLVVVSTVCLTFKEVGPSLFSLIGVYTKLYKPFAYVILLG